ncbi:MAG: four helix bundle protein [Deltaproteobacteria bacterium]
MTEKSKKVMGFEDLLVWQKGMEIVKQVYLISKEGELCRDFALRDQIRRAAISIPTNMAEGYERASRKEYVNFLNYAKGSTGEVRSLLSVAVELDYPKPTQYEALRQAALELSRYLANQIKSLRLPN